MGRQAEGRCVTAREERLRTLIDVLSDQIHDLAEERDAAVQRLARRRNSRTRRCVYCAAACYGVACVAHADLIEVDPFYTEPAKAAA
jgi:hypothetical protein